METIKIRYGESFNLSVSVDDELAQSVVFYVGKEGQEPLIVLTADIEIDKDGDAVAYVEGTPEDTQIPLGVYKYQINLITTDGKIYKFPSDDYCEQHGLPKFVVVEALDLQEVS